MYTQTQIDTDSAAYKTYMFEGGSIISVSHSQMDVSGDIHPHAANPEKYVILFKACLFSHQFGRVCEHD